MNGFKEFINEGVRDIGLEHDVINMYRDTARYSIAEISRVTGLSAGGIYRILEKNNFKPGRRDRTNMHDHVLQYAAANLPVKKISELTGYSVRQVYNIVNQSQTAHNISETLPVKSTSAWRQL